MTIKCNNHNKDIGEINLEDINKILEEHSTEEGNYLTFENEKEEFIQFIKFEDGWTIDITLNVPSDIKQANLDESQVKESIKDFFNGVSPKEISEKYGAESIN